MENKGRFYVKIGVLVLLLLVAYLWFSRDRQEKPESTKTATPQVETNAAVTIQTGIDSGESMWLLFRSETCDPCIQMQKVFNALQPDYKGKVRFIAIDVDDADNADLAQKYQIRYIPTSYIIDHQGEVSYQQVGLIPTEEVKKELDKVLKP